MRVAIYTAIFGNYDTLKEQPHFADTEYFCFTDDPSLRSKCWNITCCKGPEEHSRVTAKRFKTMPHRFLKHDVQYSIWIDGSMLIRAQDFVQRCIGSLDKWALACMPHPVGRCIFQEAEGCHTMPKYQKQNVLAQAKFYSTQGYPSDNGLAACGIIVRDHDSAEYADKLKSIGEQWFQENVDWSYQDQISFPYVLWKNNHWWDPLAIDYRDRSSFALFDHQIEL